MQVAALLATAAMLLAGCGDSDREQVSSTVEQYFDALSEREFDRACELAGPPLERTFADYARTQLRMQQAPCARVLERIAAMSDPRLVAGQGEITVRDVRFEGDTARAELSARDQRATLARIDGDWRITALDFGTR